MPVPQIERLQTSRARVANPKRVRLLVGEHTEHGGESIAFPGDERLRFRLARFDLVDAAGDAAEDDGAVLQRCNAFREKVLGLVDRDFGDFVGREQRNADGAHRDGQRSTNRASCDEFHSPYHPLPSSFCG